MERKKKDWKGGVFKCCGKGEGGRNPRFKDGDTGGDSFVGWGSGGARRPARCYIKGIQGASGQRGPRNIKKLGRWSLKVLVLHSNWGGVAS